MGSHTTFDNLSTGHADAVSGGNLVKGDLADAAALKQVFSVTRFGAVMHFASSIEVGESVANPGKYYGNNVSSTVKLPDSMVEAGVKRFACSLHVWRAPAHAD